MLPKWLGCVEYETALAEQDSCLNQVKQSGKAMVLGLEHSSTITLGKRSIESEDLKSKKATILSEGIQIVQVDRGGEATLHSPGQLVIYPIIPISVWNIGVKDYVAILERATVACLAEFGLRVQAKSKEPGLYTDKGKIVFFGIRVKQGITQHGIAINVTNDLTLFSHIRSCGVDEESFDRLQNYVPNISPDKLFSQWSDHFALCLTKR
jgi:lipoyl(octanoyl) transferase